MNTFGNILRLTTYGESHGSQIGGILDGMPAGIELDFGAIQLALNLRRPGQNSLVSPRNETDRLEILSGIYGGKTTGAPIGFCIQNTNQKSQDYTINKEIYRPSHADFTYHQKYGNYNPLGGGRSSARETANWVAAGAIAAHLLGKIEIQTFVQQIGKISIPEKYPIIDEKDIYLHPTRCPFPAIASEMEQLILDAKEKGDTLGGAISCVVNYLPIGLGSPVFHKLEAQLAHAMLSIPATKGFEIGSGFDSIEMYGSAHNDEILPDFTTITNHSGGIVGGISNGMPIQFRVAFKPVSTIFSPQNTIDFYGNPTILENKGRHDPCVVPRAVPIVKAMTQLVLAEAVLKHKLDRI